MNLIKRFERNTAGRDFAVGDIHGHFTRLQAALDAAGFDSAVDRLFSVGDLVDRGPECRDALDWLAKPWFHPVRGNHDDYVVRFDTCDVDNWIYNGGSWFAGLSLYEQKEFAVQFAELPIAIEVETQEGLVGIVHADCSFLSWDELRAELDTPESKKRLKLVMNTCMWSRSRIENQEPHGVLGIRALIVGHTPMSQPARLGNVIHIDTMGWMPGRGHFTLINLHTLETIPAMPAKLDWEAA
ncbi:serine/threonine protein phosphatase [Pseudomonas cavernicola]|uniref:Serine/threonine protein phosphatase n=1 Tax=Pseudomonas cavernicola TaxID=2320866 RepID=A0A418XEI3_9PSED|nr:metallophosphoesterase [Pseudomonas cavernicola]RJG10936.1 serine/threonine protein phosphatase [Pseudomonas cavernicola]